MSSPAPIVLQSSPSPGPAPAPIWGPKSSTVVGPFTIKASNGKYMFFDIVDHQAFVSTFDVSMSDTPQLFLFAPKTPGINKIPTNVGIPFDGTLFPAYNQSDGSLWAYASSGYNQTTGANTPGEKHMINAPFSQTQTNWSQPYIQSFNWSF